MRLRCIVWYFLSTLLLPAMSYRFLEQEEQEEDDEGNVYVSDTARLAYGVCVRVKVQNDNDDDGNPYFYNGAYHAQSISYASFFLCEEEEEDSYDQETQCGYCDRSVEYVLDLNSYIEQRVEYVQAYCNSCKNQCVDGNGEAQGDDAVEVDCDVCVDECTLMYQGNDGTDETEYIGCQEAFQEDGIQYYSSPTCSSDGGIVMGLFYDDECTIKHSNGANDFSSSFSYNTFRTMEYMCGSCSSGDWCGDLLDESIVCDYDNSQGYGNDAESQFICNKYKAVNKEWIYAQRRAHTAPWATVIFVSILLAVFCFLSYTYYVRHNSRKETKKEPLISEAINEEEPKKEGDAPKADAVVT